MPVKQGFCRSKANVTYIPYTNPHKALELLELIQSLLTDTKPVIAVNDQNNKWSNLYTLI